MNVPLHLGKFYRYIWEDAGLLVVIGHLEETLVSKRLYEERYMVRPSSPANTKTLEQVIGAAALTAVSLAERESWGWTLTLPGSPTGFFCGIEPEGMVCGQVREAETPKSIVYVQRKKGDEPLTQSSYTPKTSDPVKAIEQYFEDSAQVETRIELDESGSGVLVQALPEGRFSEIKDLESDKLLTQFRQMAGRGELNPVGEVLIFYECRCDDDMILNMITNLPGPQRKALWGDTPELNIECPRCGREYVLSRNKI